QINQTNYCIYCPKAIYFRGTICSQLLENWYKTWVRDHYAAFVKDRQGEYRKEIIFSAYPPQPVPIGKLQGIRYGFVGLKQQGGVQEQHIGHVAFDGTKLYVITTAFDTGTQTGKFEQLENLAIFQPYLYAIAADLHLPQ
ncbi:MAG: hypothetical protein V7K89_29010, partial [Nostoc sp.]